MTDEVNAGQAQEIKRISRRENRPRRSMWQISLSPPRRRTARAGHLGLRLIFKGMRGASVPVAPTDMYMYTFSPFGAQQSKLLCSCRRHSTPAEATASC